MTQENGERAMSVPELTEQDQALLDFVNAKITEANVEEAVDKLVDIAGRFEWYYTVNEKDEAELLSRSRAAADATKQGQRNRLHLGNRKTITADGLDWFQHELRRTIQSCINYRRGLLENPEYRESSVFQWPWYDLEGLNEKISRCPMAFDYSAGGFGRAVPVYNLEVEERQNEEYRRKADDLIETLGWDWEKFKSERKVAIRELLIQALRRSENDYDLSVQTAPAIAQFIHKYADQLGQCSWRNCETFFLSQKGGERKRTLCDRHENFPSVKRSRERKQANQTPRPISPRGLTVKGLWDLSKTQSWITFSHPKFKVEVKRNGRTFYIPKQHKVRLDQFESFFNHQIAPRLGNRYIREIGPQTVKGFCQKLSSEKVHPNLIENSRRVLRSMFAWAVRKGHRGDNPIPERWS